METDNVSRLSFSFRDRVIITTSIIITAESLALIGCIIGLSILGHHYVALKETSFEEKLKTKELETRLEDYQDFIDLTRQNHVTVRHNCQKEIRVLEERLTKYSECCPDERCAALALSGSRSHTSGHSITMVISCAFVTKVFCRQLN